MDTLAGLIPKWHARPPTHTELSCRLIVAANETEVGHIEISYVSSAAYSEVLPQLLVAFEKLAPEVTIGLTEADLEPQMVFLEEGRVDVALVRLPAGELATGLTTMTLRKERVVACLRADHSLASKELEIPQLANERFLSTHLREGYGFYDVALRICNSAGFEPHIVSRSHQFATIVSLVAAGKGVALVPESVRKLTMPGVVYADLSGCEVTSDIAIAYHAADNSPVARRFFGLCAEFGRAG
ncbi:LysR family substrate-binding domain-containing protein [Paraburkholderia sp. SIMBA_055]